MKNPNQMTIPQTIGSLIWILGLIGIALGGSAVCINLAVHPSLKCILMVCLITGVSLEIRDITEKLIIIQK